MSSCRSFRRVTGGSRPRASPSQPSRQPAGPRNLPARRRSPQADAPDAEPGFERMLLAGANTAGGQSTLGTVTTLFILVLAVAGAAVLLGWAARRLKEPGRRPRSTTTGLAPALVR